MTDCGCSVDGEGFWVLSEKCKQEELQVWKDMLDHWYERSTTYTTQSPRDKAVAYFRQELRKAEYNK